MTDIFKGTKDLIDAYLGGFLTKEDLDEALSLGLTTPQIHHVLSRKLG